MLFEEEIDLDEALSLYERAEKRSPEAAASTLLGLLERTVRGGGNLDRVCRCTDPDNTFSHHRSRLVEATLARHGISL